MPSNVYQSFVYQKYSLVLLEPKAFRRHCHLLKEGFQSLGPSLPTVDHGATSHIIFPDCQGQLLMELLQETGSPHSMDTVVFTKPFIHIPALYVSNSEILIAIPPCSFTSNTFSQIQCHSKPCKTGIG